MRLFLPAAPARPTTWQMCIRDRPYGLYHYSYALNESEMMREADGLIALARQFSPRMPVAIDMEDADGYKERNGTLYNKALNTEICRYTCQKIEEAGFYPMVDVYKRQIIHFISACV